MPSMKAKFISLIHSIFGQTYGPWVNLVSSWILATDVKEVKSVLKNMTRLRLARHKKVGLARPTGLAICVMDYKEY